MTDGFSSQYYSLRSSSEPNFRTESLVALKDFTESSEEQFQGAEKNRLSQSSEYDSFQSEDGRGLTAFDYARYYGLTTNYLDEYPPGYAALPAGPENLYDDLQDPPGVPNVATLINPETFDGNIVRERLDVDRNCAEFLASVLAASKEDAVDDGIWLDDGPWFADLKLVEPVVASDPHLDVLELKRRNTVALSTRGMEPFKLADEKNESLNWPAEDLLLPGKMAREASREKFEVDRETAAYLMDVFNPPQLREADVFDAEFGKGKDQHLKPITPPLLPLSPPLSPSAVASCVEELELMSTPEDLTALEAMEMERVIMVRDDIPQHSKGSELEAYEPGENLSEFSSLIKTPSLPSPVQPKSWGDLEADVPLLPQDPEESPVQKAKALSIPTELRSLIPTLSSDISIMDSEVLEREIDSLIADVIGPMATPALEQIENEELVEVDTTMRVNVPPIEEFTPTPPWKLFGSGDSGCDGIVAQRVLMAQTKQVLTKEEVSWGGVSKIERLLPWSPFPARLGKVGLEEDLSDGSPATYMDELAFDKPVDAESTMPKTDRLQILDAQDGDDDHLDTVFVHEATEASPGPAESPTDVPTLSPSRQNALSTAPVSPKPVGPISGHMDLQTLLRKRKREIEAAEHLETRSFNDRGEPKHQSPSRRPDTPCGTKPRGFSELMGGGGLSGFLRLHGDFTYDDEASRPNLPKHQQCDPHGPSMPCAVETSVMDKSTSPQKPLPIPEAKTLTKPTPVIVSSTVLANRSLARHIQSALPLMELIERGSIQPLIPPTSKATAANQSPEADFTCSAGTGIVTTTLQKLKQKPLPGQRGFYGIRERIASIAVRYERLIVLVNEGQHASAHHPSPARPLDERDCEALSDLAGFAAVLPADVEVSYVPGGEAELEKWIAALISRHVVTDDVDATPLLLEETMWERFLRTAGLNAFAAQVVLATLKAPPAPETEESELPSTGQAHGLAAFVEMDAERRVQRFGSILGGDRVLRRVSEVIDRGWMSAARLNGAKRG